MFFGENHKNDEANSCCTFVLVATDGGTESSALVDDNGSEEDYSYEELCQATPRYLQPGGEQLAINEVTSWALHGCNDGVGHVGCVVSTGLRFHINKKCNDSSRHSEESSSHSVLSLAWPVSRCQGKSIGTSTFLGA